MRPHCKFFLAAALLALLTAGLYLAVVSPAGQLLKRPAVAAVRGAIVVGLLGAVCACIGGIAGPAGDEDDEATPLLEGVRVVAAAPGHNSLPYILAN